MKCSLGHLRTTQVGWKKMMQLKLGSQSNKYNSYGILKLLPLYNSQRNKQPMFDDSSSQRQKQQTLERPTLRSRGLTAPDPFFTRERIQFVDSLPEDIEQLRLKSFQTTEKGVVYRKKTAHGATFQVQVKLGRNLIKLKTGAEYLSQGFRTIAIEMKDMLVDLNKLSKILSKQQFEETQYVAS